MNLEVIFKRPCNSVRIRKRFFMCVILYSNTYMTELILRNIRVRIRVKASDRVWS